MTVDCARDPGRTRTGISSSYTRWPVRSAGFDSGITPNSPDAETNGQGTILEACSKQNWIPRNIIVVHQTCSRGFSE